MENVVVQFLPFFCRIHHKDSDKEHPLIPGLQVFQKVLRFFPIGHKVRRQHIHVVTGTHRPLLLLNLHLVQVRDFTLDHLDGRGLVNGLDMDIHIDTLIHIQKICQHTVGQFRCEDLQVTDASQCLSHHK